LLRPPRSRISSNRPRGWHGAPQGGASGGRNGRTSRRFAGPARVAAAAVLLIVHALGASSASAETRFPTELKTVGEIRFEGRKHVTEKELMVVMKTRRPSLFPWRERPLLRMDFLRADTSAIEQVYRAHGFLDARAHVRLESIKKSESERVIFTVEEGVQARIRRVDFLDLGAVSESQLRRKLYARPGRPFNPLYLLADTAKIASEYRERGYLPSVTASAVRNGDSIAVAFQIAQGPQYRFGETYLSSPDKLRIKSNLVMRELLYQPGQIYKASRVADTIEDIYGTGLFSQVQMTPLPDSSNKVVEFDLRLRERSRRWFDTGVGSGTEERLRFTGEWGHRNVNKRGLQTVLASRLALDSDARFLLFRGETSLFDPWILRDRRRALVSLYYENHHDRANPGFLLKQESKGITFQVRREYSTFTRLVLTQDNTWVQQWLDELSPDVPPAVIDSLVGRYATHRLQLLLSRDTRDDILNTYRGSWYNLIAEIAGGPLQGTSSFTKLLGEVSGYRPIKRGWVIAARLRSGSIDPFGTPPAFTPTPIGIDPEVASVPLEDRFRIGGVNSLRGYNENELPPYGGLAVIQGNVEARIPIVGPFGLEAFVDFGNVWPRASYIKAGDFRPGIGDAPYDGGDVRYVAGLGERLNLPFGPLRLDVSWSGRPEIVGHDRHAVWQFAIGPTF